LSRIFAGTTVGSARYLGEWAKGIQRLGPEKIVVSVDDSRHEDVPSGLPCELIHYDTGRVWESYDARHKNFISDYSIALGIKNLIAYFLRSDCTHFLCLDSDVILDETMATKIRNLDYEYLQMGVPETNRQALKIMYLMWEGTNFGLNKEIATKLYPKLDYYNINNSKPVDLKLHDLIRSCDPKSRIKVKSRGLIHYFNRGGRTRRVSGFEAELKSIYSKPSMFLYGKLIHPPMYRPSDRAELLSSISRQN
jgi:hypothetical protein